MCGGFIEEATSYLNLVHYSWKRVVEEREENGYQKIMRECRNYCMVSIEGSQNTYIRYD